MVQSKGIGMAFDGEGLAYYYKDLEKASWWKSQNANWNTALSEAITANKNYIDAKVGDILNSQETHISRLTYLIIQNAKRGQDFWDEEKRALNDYMFNDHEKTRHYAKVIVEWSPVGYTRKFNYGVLITKTNMFTADQIQAVADGAAKNQAIIQGYSRH